jgi:uncharacterized integral membrane protein
MIFRLVLYILLLILVATFIGLNWQNGSDVDFWFGGKARISDVPVCISMLAAYILGVISVVPFIIKRLLRQKRKEKHLHRPPVPSAGVTGLSQDPEEDET